MDKILKDLFSFQDIEYKDFNSKLIPTVDKDLIIGVRTPILRNYAKKLFKEDEKRTFNFLIIYIINIMKKIIYMAV